MDDPDARIREAVANKRKLSMPYLEKLAYESDEYVRQKVVEHKKITRHIPEVLAEDRFLGIAKRAARRIDERDYRE